MAEVAEAPSKSESIRSEHFNVLIVGAGISGVGGAWHLQQRRPGTSFVLLESQETFGGTWRTHKYPGIRSDSDLYTFGYGFKPWTSAPIATAEEILKYMGEVIEENEIDRHIRYRHRIEAARWDSTDRLWTLDVVRLDTGERLRFTGNFLWMCQGYYRHSEGYTPEWPGMEDFKGQIVHPQTWPENLDYADKRVVLIGSGATAATIIPAMAGKCKHITMLQRTPTYFVTGRNANVLADMLRELDIDETWIHEIVRRKILFDQKTIVRRSFEEPEALRAELLAGVRAALGEFGDLVEKHFSPTYRPWHQRIAFVPDADLFKAVRDGHASVVTDHIDRFVENGILLKSGEVLEADLIITATGFHLSVLGDIDFTIDGKPLNFADTTTWRGMMFTGVPNMLWVFGYLRASWTLRADMLAEFVCRLLDEMDARGATRVVPTLRPEDAGMPSLPWITEDNFNPGYVQRGVNLLPRQGDHMPWMHTQDYWLDKEDIPAADLGDGSLVFD
ncbi:MAG: NAD(P)/FAD-dependent oxidoreductase [Burkholderiaceae bacterium]